MQVTDFLAIYGAALSTAVFYWNTRNTRANLRVRIVHASEETSPGSYVAGIRVNVQNPSLHAAHLNSIMIVYPFRRPPIKEVVGHILKFRTLRTRQGWCHAHLSIFGTADGCPVTIEPHKAHGVFISEDTLAEIRADSIEPALKVMVQDALWRNRYSKTFRY